MKYKKMVSGETEEVLLELKPEDEKELTRLNG